METSSSSVDGAGAKGPLAMLEGIADGLSLVAAFLAAACIVALTGLILAEIVVAFVARFFPGMPAGIGIGWEYSAYLMGGAFMLGSGMTLRAGQQIRVELLLRAKGGRYVRGLEIASCVLGSVTTIYLAVTLIAFTWRTYSFGEASQDSFTPLWIPQVVLCVGAVILAIQMVVRTLASLIGGRVDRPELGAATAIEG
jgi:TRAP-type mannitol/chloroaromatic compound transport system permease small subunit